MLDDPEKCYEDLSIFLFHFRSSRATWLSHITKYLSHLLSNCKKVEALFDPERPNTYLRISQLIATYNSYLVRVELESSLEFVTNIYWLRIDLQIIPVSLHEDVIHQTEDVPSSYGWLPCDLDCICICSYLHYSGIIRLLSIDCTNGNGHSSQSLANQFFESTPNSLTVHSTHLRTLGSFPCHGHLTSTHSSCYLSDTF